MPNYISSQQELQCTYNQQGTYKMQFARTGYSPLLIVDFRVIAWKIYPLVDQFKDMLGHLSEHKKKKEIESFTKACWALAINRGPDFLPRNNYTIVVVDDNASSVDENGDPIPYWRTTRLKEHWESPEQAAHVQELKEQHEKKEQRRLKRNPDAPPKEFDLGYKAGRSHKPDAWQSVAQIGLNYINDPKSQLHYFSTPSYEADDWAGGAVWAKRLLQRDVGCALETSQVLRDREVFLYTIDTDWLQLAGDGVWWCNTGPWQPRLRGELEAIAYIKKKSLLRTHRALPKGEVSSAHEIVDIKMMEGDSSDNLPAGSPRWAIDLINSHPDHHIKNSESWPRYLGALCTDEPNIRHDHYQSALNWLVSKGYPLVVDCASTFAQGVA